MNTPSEDERAQKYLDDIDREVLGPNYKRILEVRYALCRRDRWAGEVLRARSGAMPRSSRAESHLKHDRLFRGWAAAFHVHTKFMCQGRNARQRQQREFIAVRCFRRLVLDSSLLVTFICVLDSGSPLEMCFGSGLPLLVIVVFDSCLQLWSSL